MNNEQVGVCWVEMSYVNCSKLWSVGWMLPFALLFVFEFFFASTCVFLRWRRDRERGVLLGRWAGNREKVGRTSNKAAFLGGFLSQCYIPHTRTEAIHQPTSIQFIQSNPPCVLLLFSATAMAVMSYLC